MSIRRKTDNRRFLIRTCWTCGKVFQTSAASPWMRQLYNVDGKKQKTCFFCSSACKEASYKMPHHGRGKINSEERSRTRRHTSEENRRYYAEHAEHERARARARYWADPEAARANSRYQRRKKESFQMELDPGYFETAKQRIEGKENGIHTEPELWQGQSGVFGCY